MQLIFLVQFKHYGMAEILLVWKIAFWNANAIIYIYTLLVCLSVGLFFVSNKRPNGWHDRAKVLCGTSHNPGEGLWMIKISKISLQWNLIVIHFLKSWKLFDKFHKLIVLFLFYNVHKENIFTIEIEDGLARCGLKA